MLTPNRNCQIITHLIKSDNTFPNNARWPLLIYKSVFPATTKTDDNEKHKSSELIATSFESQLKQNGWTPLWRDIIYPYAHYHSQSHEGLGVFQGSCTVQFGGKNGVTTTVEAGDYVLIPAGVSHESLHRTNDFSVVGSYPNDGSCVDMKYGKSMEERTVAEENIARVPLPSTDPLFGESGPLFRLWKNE